MDQSTTNIRRQNWMNIISQCQARPTNITAKQWLADNAVKEKAYYYWLRKFRREAHDQMVPVPTQAAEVSFAEVSIPIHTIPVTSDVSVTPSCDHPAAVIRKNEMILELSNDISENLLTKLLQEVSVHA